LTSRKKWTCGLVRRVERKRQRDDDRQGFHLARLYTLR
jgi:hypothetical protein